MAKIEEHATMQNAQLEEIRLEIVKLLEEHQRKMDLFRGLIESERESEQRHKEAALAAAEACDAKTNHKELADASLAGDAASMYENKLKQLTNDPIISEKESKALMDRIEAIASAHVSEAKHRLTETIAPLRELRDEMSAEDKDTNDLLFAVQKRLMRDPETIRRDLPSRRFEDRELLPALSRIIETVFYGDGDTLNWTMNFVTDEQTDEDEK